MMLILVICLISLALHFFTESMGPQGLFSSASDAAGHYDDTFILICFSFLPASILFMKIRSEEISFQRSFGRPPLLPPPSF